MRTGNRRARMGEGGVEKRIQRDPAQAVGEQVTGDFQYFKVAQDKEYAHCEEDRRADLEIPLRLR